MIENRANLDSSPSKLETGSTDSNISIEDTSLVTLASTLGDRFKAAFIGKIIAIVSGAALVVILARLLDPDGYGLLFWTISILTIVRMVSRLGIAKSAARYVAQYQETDRTQLRHIVRFSLILNLSVIMVVCVSLSLSSRLLSNFLGEPELAPLLHLGVFFVVFSTLTLYARSLLQGFEAIQASASVNAIDRVLRLGLAVGLVVMGYEVIGALLGYILASAVASSVGICYLYVRYYREAPRGEIESSLRKRITEYAVPLTATDAAGVLDKRVDTLLVGFFIDPVAVSFYTVGKQIVQFIQTPVSALGFTLSPTYETQKAKGNPDVARKIYEEALFHGLLLYIPAAAGLILVAEPLVFLVFGRGYLGAVPVLQVLAIYAVVQAIATLTSSGLDYLGRARARAIVKGLTSIANFILNLIFIPWFGVIGAAIATVITFSIYTMANVYLMHTELNLRFPSLLRQVGLVLGITAVMSIIVYPLVGFIDGFATLLAVTGVGVGTWTVFVVGVGLLDPRRVISILT